MSQKLSGVKGMNDLLPPEINVWHHAEAAARETCRRFGYSEIRTPMVEDTALFTRSVGEETDIVGKEMYTFLDKGDRSLSLRPEGTAACARAYIEHSILNREPVTRWFYMGPMFRYERMKTGRYRQFYQLGAEAYGVKEPAQEVEQMDMVVQMLKMLGLRGVSLEVNSLGDGQCRPAYMEQLVAFLKGRRMELCADCQARLDKNPLRVLDCKTEACRSVLRSSPNMLDHLCEPCRAHFDEVRRKLGALGLSYEVNPRIVRGLDYYTRTVFEFIANDPVLGTASAVGGGGRYDNMMKELGGPDVPAVGLAMGLDRLCLLMGKEGDRYNVVPDLFIASVDEKASDFTLVLASKLRAQGFSIETDPRGGSLKSQMKRADKTQARFALVLGEAELSQEAFALKPMAGGEPLKGSSFDELPALLRGSGDRLKPRRVEA